MPGLYVATNRAAARGRAGLALPYTPTSGPLALRSTAGMLQVPMSAPQSGDAQTFGHQGIWTTGVSDCSVVAVVEYHGGAWRRFFFEHVAGSNCIPKIRQAARDALNGAVGHRFGVVAQYYGGSAFGSADELFNAALVPPANRSYYQSGFSGMSFGIRWMNGEFGEAI